MFSVVQIQYYHPCWLTLDALAGLSLSADRRMLVTACHDGFTRLYCREERWLAGLTLQTGHVGAVGALDDSGQTHMVDPVRKGKSPRHRRTGEDHRRGLGIGGGDRRRQRARAAQVAEAEGVVAVEQDARTAPGRTHGRGGAGAHAGARLLTGCGPARAGTRGGRPGRRAREG